MAEQPGVTFRSQRTSRRSGKEFTTCSSILRPCRTCSLGPTRYSLRNACIGSIRDARHVSGRVTRGRLPGEHYTGLTNPIAATGAAEADPGSPRRLGGITEDTPPSSSTIRTTRPSLLSLQCCARCSLREQRRRHLRCRIMGQSSEPKTFKGTLGGLLRIHPRLMIERVSRWREVLLQ